MPTLKHRRAVAIAALLLAAGGAYLWGAFAHARLVNTDPNLWDQGPALSEAISLRTSGYAAATNRNQMPLYPIYLSLFHTPNQSAADFFERAKAASIGLSVALLALVFAALWRRLPVHPALNIFLITAFTIFLFKAPYCQAELLYYTLAFLAFLNMIDAIDRVSVGSAARAGILSALAWLTKASNLPVFVLFLFFLGIRSLSFLRRGERPRARAAALGLALSSVIFLGILSPYLVTSRRLYGHYFYNVNSDFNIWHDSWAHAQAHRRDLEARGLRVADLPAEERVGPLRYLETHAPSQIAHRLVFGAIETILVAATSFGYFEYAAGYFLLLALLSLWKRHRAEEAIARRPFVGAFAALFFVGSFFLCAFYVPIAPGPRFALALFLPFMFTAAKVCEEISGDTVLTLGARSLRLLPAFNVFLSVVLAMDVLQILAKGLFAMPGGG
jgi:hypothetical protein